MTENLKKTMTHAFRLTLPVLTGYVFLGMTFGLLAKTSGFDWWVPVLMSLIIYSGALEFAAIPLMLGSFDPIGAFVLGVTLSARHLFYGLPMLKKYEGKKTKPFLIFGLTDETFSILSVTEVPEGCQSSAFYLFVTLFDYLYWLGGTAIGALLGSTVRLNFEGLDFVLTALFIVLFIEQMKTKTGLKSGLVGLVSSILALVIFGSEYFVLIAMAILLVALIAGRSLISRD